MDQSVLHIGGINCKKPEEKGQSYCKTGYEHPAYTALLITSIEIIEKIESGTAISAKGIVIE